MINLKNNFNQLLATGNLFVSEVRGDRLWDVYMDHTDNTTFRDPESSVYNCNHCKNFIKRYGNIVAMDENNNIITLFDSPDDEYANVFPHMSKELLK